MQTSFRSMPISKERGQGVHSSGFGRGWWVSRRITFKLAVFLQALRWPRCLGTYCGPRHGVLQDSPQHLPLGVLLLGPLLRKAKYDRHSEKNTYTQTVIATL